MEVLRAKISDKTSDNYERPHRIDLPKADSGWLVRVRRITPNSTSEYISDKMYIAAVTEVIDAKLRYPNTALLGLQYDAETFGNVAKVAMDTKGRLLKFLLITIQQHGNMLGCGTVLSKRLILTTLHGSITTSVQLIAMR